MKKKKEAEGEEEDEEEADGFNEEYLRNDTSFGFLKAEYNMDLCPADVELALKHERANRIGKINIDFKKINQHQICECCFFPIAYERFSLFCSRQDLAYLGPGLTLYLEFIYLTGFLVLGFVLVSSLPTILVNSLSSGENISDEGFLVHYSMISNSSKLNYSNREYMTVFLVPIMVFIIEMMQKIQKRTLIKCDESLLSPSDYTLMFIGLPNGDYSVPEIKELVMKYVAKLSLEKEGAIPISVEKVVLSHDISAKIEELKSIEFMKTNQTKSLMKMRINPKHKINSRMASDLAANLTINFTKELGELQPKAGTQHTKMYLGDASNSRFPRLNNQFVSIDCAGSPVSKLKGIKRVTSNDLSDFGDRNGDECFKTSGVVFVTLNQQKGVELFEKVHEMGTIEWLIRRLVFKVFKRKPGRKGIVFKDCLVNVKRAPEPSDVLWENLAIRNQEIVRRRAKGYFLTFLMICFSFFLVTTCTYLENIFEVHSKSNKIENTNIVRTIIKIFKSLVIFLGNEVIEFILEKVTSYEKHKSVSSFNANLFGKIFKVQYLNTIFLIPLSRIFLADYDVESKVDFLEDIWFLYITVAILQPIFNLIDPRYYALQLRKRRIQNAKIPVIITQKEANKIFEGLGVNITKNYVHFLLMISFTFFYSSLIPILSIISIFSVVLFYYTTKYEILARNSRPVHIGPNINLIATKYIQLIPMQFVIVENFFIKLIRFQIDREIRLDTLAVISLVTAICLRFFPWNILATRWKKRFLSSKTIVETSYKEICLEFENDYDRANPVTKKIALKKWIEALDNKRKMMKSVQRQRDAVRNLVKLKKYGLMMKAMCNNVESALKLYVAGGPKNQFRFQSSEVLQTLKMNTLIKYSKTLRIDENTERQNSNEFSIKDASLHIEQKLKELISYPKFFDPIDNSSRQGLGMLTDNSRKV